MFYNVIRLAQQDFQQLLVVIGKDNDPAITVYDEHHGQTILRMCEPNVENLQRALDILKGKATGDF